jgi:exodeoxyribonuclease VII small subunit
VKEKTPKLPSLEESLGEITGVIEKMENGELTLEQSLTHFERGIVLIKHCQKILTAAEQKVQMLVQQNQQETLTPYGDEKDNSDDDTND